MVAVVLLPVTRGASIGEGPEVGAMATLAANLGVGAMWAKQILDNWDEWEDKE